MIPVGRRPRPDRCSNGFRTQPGARSVIQVDVTRISSSCGYGVPLMELRRRAHAAHRVGREAGRGRAREVPGREERDEHQRSPRMGVTEQLAARQARARARMDELGVDVLLLSVGADLPYLTGYEAMPLERLTMLVLPRDGDAILVVPELEAPRVEPDPGSSSSEPGPRPRTRSRSWPDSSVPRRGRSRSATRPGRASCCGSRTRSRPRRCSAASDGHRRAADREGPGRGGGAARRGARGRCGRRGDATAAVRRAHRARRPPRARRPDPRARASTGELRDRRVRAERREPPSRGEQPG